MQIEKSNPLRAAPRPAVGDGAERLNEAGRQRPGTAGSSRSLTNRTHSDAGRLLTKGSAGRRHARGGATRGPIGGRIHTNRQSEPIQRARAIGDRSAEMPDSPRVEPRRVPRGPQVHPAGERRHANRQTEPICDIRCRGVGDARRATKRSRRTGGHGRREGWTEGRSAVGSAPTP